MAETIRNSPPLRLRANEQRTFLFFGDFLMSVVSLFAALELWKRYNISVQMSELLEFGMAVGRAQRLAELRAQIEIPFWFYLLPLVWLILLVELYEPHTSASGRKTARGIAVAAILGLVAYSLVFITRQDTNLPRIGVGAFLFFASILTLVWRMLFIRFYKRTGEFRRILVIGAGGAGQTLAEIYQASGIRSFNLIGFIDDDPQKKGSFLTGFPVLGTSRDLIELIQTHKISDLVVAINGVIQGSTFQTILDAQEFGVDVTRMPILYEEMTSRVPIHHLESDWIIRSFVDGLSVSGFYELFKRLVDILGGAVGLVILAAVTPFMALAIYMDSGLPIFYSQSRLGRGRREFTIYKFRSMFNNTDEFNDVRRTTENDPRITRVGNILRKLRLDELPQFWNVLRGDMSLVGPRAEVPALVEEYQKQIPFYRARLLVKPGLTGWAQINYGYVASVTETAIKLEFDLYYIKHRTFLMDVQIILRTISTVLRRTGR